MLRSLLARDPELPNRLSRLLRGAAVVWATGSGGARLDRLGGRAPADQAAGRKLVSPSVLETALRSVPAARLPAVHGPVLPAGAGVARAARSSTESALLFSWPEKRRAGLPVPMKPAGPRRPPRFDFRTREGTRTRPKRLSARGASDERCGVQIFPVRSRRNDHDPRRNRSRHAAHPGLKAVISADSTGPNGLEPVGANHWQTSTRGRNHRSPFQTGCRRVQQHTPHKSLRVP